MIRLFRVFIPASVVALLLAEACVVFVCLLIATYVAMPDDAEIFLLYDAGLARLSVVVVTVLFLMYIQDLYKQVRITSRVMLVQQIVLVLGVVLLLQAMLAYLLPGSMVPRSVMLVATALLLVCLPVWRIAFTSFIYKGFRAERVLFLGASQVAADIVECLKEKAEFGLSPIGIVDDERDRSENLLGVPVLGKVADVREIALQQSATQIVVAMSDRRGRMPVYDLLDLRFRGIRVVEAANLYETTFGRVPIRELRPSQLIFTSELGPRPSQLKLQTLYSTMIALVGIVVSIPIMILVAIAVKLTSAGPILFRQTRVGLHGEVFQIYKFRSMIADAEAKTGAVWASKRDPRLTVIGGMLRTLRLDEMPQLFNVLRGEMSIVGPRPERPEFVKMLSEQVPFYPQRHFVKPGITGWAQINYKYGETIEDTITKLEYDLYYIKNISPSLDSFIMFHTLKVMLFSKFGQ